MTDNSLRYDRMVEDALRGVVRTALENTIEHGLSGDHHFYLTFSTEASDVVMPVFLRDRYPEEMTIVLQHVFRDLWVSEDAFGVSLSFDNQFVELTVPFVALSAFVDPSVKFGLQFNVEESADASGTKKQGGSVPAIRKPGDLVTVPETATADNDTDDEADKPTAEVVNLETFRKK
ncbi:MAG: ClpXP protease specificity-enhancing factor SspB [Alphaproteobacteria bacterium]|nr:ClpXP protease specificity-enhancing factor SspB [Alphaproteobacteria bacterium]MCZ6590463.1 ClpXP protease specificity-enhancing factor SspB [Alphaproteobacteria bacterium]MCZ6846667.1 ClpXP protease specificity-enhancing factor SspB [Alphaproteobacteria bacterium]